MEKLKQYATTGVSFAVLIAFITFLAIPTKGPTYCRKAIKYHMPQLLEEAVETKSIFSRTIKDYWISSLVLQPIDLNQEQITVVCYFKSTNYVLGSLKIYNGNKLNEIKSISLSNHDPRTWFK